jgi:uncharacterized protein (DUF58 family)
MAPQRIRLLPGGHVVIAMTLLLGVAAVHTGLNLLHALVAALLSFQTVSGFRSFLGLRRVTVEVASPPCVDAGGETSLEVAVSNGKRRVASSSIEVTVEVEEAGRVDVGGAWVARLDPGERVVLRLPVRGVARGVARVAAVRLSTSYPCDLLRRSALAPVGDEVLVRPRRREVRATSPTGEDDLRAARAPLAATGPGDLRSLRPFRDGDSPRAVHWRTTARRRALHVREDESRAPAAWAVRLGPSPALPRERVDEEAEDAAGLLRRARADGRAAWLCLGGERAPRRVHDARSLSAALDALARFEPSVAPAPAAPAGARVVVARRAPTEAREGFAVPGVA